MCNYMNTFTHLRWKGACQTGSKLGEHLHNFLILIYDITISTPPPPPPQKKKKKKKTQKTPTYSYSFEKALTQ